MITIPKKEPLNLVPFIDIMLVLLAMVLSISTFIAKGEIQIKLPESDTAESVTHEEEPTVIQVDASGEIFVAGEKTSMEAFKAFVERLDPKTQVMLRMDKDTRFESFIQIIDLFKAKNHENFSIQTEKSDSNKN